MLSLVWAPVLIRISARLLTTSTCHCEISAPNVSYPFTPVTNWTARINPSKNGPLRCFGWPVTISAWEMILTWPTPTPHCRKETVPGLGAGTDCVRSPVASVMSSQLVQHPLLLYHYYCLPFLLLQLSALLVLGPILITITTTITITYVITITFIITVAFRVSITINICKHYK